jgi:hypothetical protein
MPTNDARAVETALANLAERFAADPHLHAEMLRARRQFFGSDTPASPDVRGAVDAAEQRFVEWFALERDSEVLGAVPIDVPRFADVEGLTGSVVGVLLVTAAGGDAFEASDLQDGDVFDLDVPAGSLQEGDLLVGRLYPQADGRWTPSAAAAVFRPGTDIAEAFRRDIARVEIDRRLYQIEVEHLLLRRAGQTPSPTAKPADIVPLERLEAELATLLENTDGRHTAEAVSQRLADAERPGQVMGPLLEEWAFETTIDLDAARRVMLEIWNAWHPEVPSAAPADDVPRTAPGETLGERLVRTLDEGLEKKRDVEDLFAQLERMAGLEPGASDDGENPFDRDDADDEDEVEEVDATAGDLAPLVQEYLWETGREQDPRTSPLRLWIELQRNAAVPRTDLEAVTGHDLMRLLLHCYLGAAPDRRAAAVRDAWAELQRFYEWAQQVHELELGSALQHCRGGLVEHVDRLQAAGQALSSGSASTAGASTGKPSIFAIDEVRGDGFGVRDDDGGHRWIPAPRATAALLRAGDLVLGTVAPAGSGGTIHGLVVVLPFDARALME